MRFLSIARIGLLFAVLLVVGCSSKNKGKIEGTSWSSMPTTVKGTTLPAGALKLDFDSTGALTYHVQSQPPMKGRYTLSFGDNVVFRFDQPLAGRKVHTEKIVINGNQLIMTDSDGTTVTFTKQNGSNETS